MDSEVTERVISDLNSRGSVHGFLIQNSDGSLQYISYDDEGKVRFLSDKAPCGVRIFANNPDGTISGLVDVVEKV